MEQNIISLLPLYCHQSHESCQRRKLVAIVHEKSLVYRFMLLWKISCEWLMQMCNKGVIILGWRWHLLWVTWAAEKRPCCINTPQDSSLFTVTLHQTHPLSLNVQALLGLEPINTSQEVQKNHSANIQTLLSLFLIWFITGSKIPPGVCKWAPLRPWSRIN